MFRCFDCGKEFEAPVEQFETHGLHRPPYERWLVCPHCKRRNYKPFLKNNVSRRKIIDALLDVIMLLNIHDHKICSAFNTSATDDTELDFARSKLFELITETSVDDEFDLPRNIDTKIFDMQTVTAASEIERTLTKNIEEDF